MCSVYLLKAANYRVMFVVNKDVKKLECGISIKIGNFKNQWKLLFILPLQTPLHKILSSGTLINDCIKPFPCVEILCFETK